MLMMLLVQHPVLVSQIRFGSKLPSDVKKQSLSCPHSPQYPVPPPRCEIGGGATGGATGGGATGGGATGGGAIGGATGGATGGLICGH